MMRKRVTEIERISDIGINYCLAAFAHAGGGPLFVPAGQLKVITYQSQQDSLIGMGRFPYRTCGGELTFRYDICVYPRQA
jgi:hypothetical protein